MILLIFLGSLVSDYLGKRVLAKYFGGNQYYYAMTPTIVPHTDDLYVQFDCGFFLKMSVKDLFLISEFDFKIGDYVVTYTFGRMYSLGIIIIEYIDFN